MRAREPDRSGFADQDGVGEVFEGVEDAAGVFAELLGDGGWGCGGRWCD